MKRAFPFLLPLFVLLLAGCHTVSYVTPGGPANLEAIQDYEIRDGFETVPAAEFPARLAIVRVQQSGYRSEGNRGFGEGRFSVVTHHDVESEEHFQRISELPQVAGFARLNSLLVPSRLQSVKDLRRAVAPLHADLLLMYTLNTTFHMEKKRLAPLTVFSLGVVPGKKAKIQCTASAVLVDVRTGHIHGLSEAVDESERPVNAWNRKSVVDRARLDVEEQAFDKLVNAFAETWNGILAERRSSDGVNASQQRQGHHDKANPQENDRRSIVWSLHGFSQRLIASSILKSAEAGDKEFIPFQAANRGAGIDKTLNVQ